MALWLALAHCSVQGVIRYPGDHFEADEADLGVLVDRGLVKAAPADWDPDLQIPEPDPADITPDTHEVTAEDQQLVDVTPDAAAAPSHEE